MLATLGLLLALAGPAADPSDWRLAADPRDSAEAAAREAAVLEGTDALLAAAARFPGTPASGLARLAAGLRLVEAGRPADAVAQLSHPDVALTHLHDHALLALARAQEALGQKDAAARSALAAGTDPAGATACDALPRAARLFAASGQPAMAAPALERTAAACPREAPSALLELGKAHLALGEPAAAAAVLARLDREHPASRPAKEARAHLAALAAHLPPHPAEERARQLLERGAALLAAGQAAEAVVALQAVPTAQLPPADVDLLRVKLGRALLVRGRGAEGRAALRKVGPGSPHAAEAAYHLARDAARRTRDAQPYVAVADGFPGTPWAEESLLALANHYQKDALDEAAARWWRRLAEEFPDGRYVERAAWRAGWDDYRAGRHEAAARLLETTARLRPPSASTPGFLYWAARARAALGQKERARALLAETVLRYKHAYHGIRAREALARLGGAPAPASAVTAALPPPEPPLGEPRATRVRQLLLVERLDEAAAELRLVPESPRVQATIAWIDWRRGRLRPAITAMKRAYPEWVGEAGDRLPREVWQILFPLRYERELRAAAAEEGLDPALVAALVLQESTFDPGALSRAGARGLMQVMPATGRTIARAKGRRFQRAALHDPVTSLDFGTHYLRQMSERFGGAVEKVLAAYNAGPHRVDAWTASRGETSAEEFTESIPFSETRGYVMIVLANREQYRRLYGLERSAPAPAVEGARP